MQHGIPNPTSRQALLAASQHCQLPIDSCHCKSLEPDVLAFSASAGDIYKLTSTTCHLALRRFKANNRISFRTFVNQFISSIQLADTYCATTPMNFQRTSFLSCLNSSPIAFYLRSQVELKNSKQLAAKSIKLSKLKDFFLTFIKEITVKNLFDCLKFTTIQALQIPPVHKAMDCHFRWRFL
jgi:hypothetical protein